MFKPGQSGNPLGPKKISQVVFEKKMITQEVAISAMSKIMLMNLEDLREFLKDKNTNAAELMIGRVVVRAIELGDVTRLGFLFDRMFGKQTEKVQIEGSVHSSVMFILDRLRKVDGDDE